MELRENTVYFDLSVHFIVYTTCILILMLFPLLIVRIFIITAINVLIFMTVFND